MDNPYFILDVANNASPDEIKKAYRRLASTAHPDREGGSNEEMARLSVAYDILSDPAKRARFDETGETNEVPLIDKQVSEVLMGMFLELLEESNSNLIIKVRMNCEAQIAQAEQHIVITSKKVDKIEARIKLVTHEGETPNLVEMVAQQRLGVLRDSMKKAGEVSNLFKFALLRLEEYKDAAVNTTDLETAFGKAWLR